MELKELNALYHDSLLNIHENSEEVLEKYFGEVIYSEDFTESVKILQDIFIDLVVINVDKKSLYGKSLIKLIELKHTGLPILLISKDPYEITDELTYENIFKISLQDMANEEVVSGFLEQEKDCIVEFCQKRGERFLYKLEESLSVMESIDEYFKTIVRQLIKFDKEAPEKKMMNFEIMDTFLLTAYDSLKSIDGNFTNTEFDTLFKQYKLAKKIRRSFKNKTKNSSSVNFREVFLLHQAEYVDMLNRKNHLQEEIYTLSGKHSILEQKMKKTKSLIQKNKNSDELKKLYSIKKKLSGLNVDVIHKLQSAKDSILQLNDRMNDFEEKYKDEFMEVYELKIDSLKSELKTVLDILTFRVDKTMWKCAKKSSNIIEFFDSARIRGVFSSTTYLKYYLRQVDEKNAGSNTKKLIKYLRYWSEVSIKKVAIISDNGEIIQRARSEIQRIDTTIRVMGYMSMEGLITGHKTHSFDLVLSCTDIGYCSGVDLFKTFNKANIGNSREVELALMHSKASRYKVTRSCIESSKVGHIINLDEGWDKFSRKVMEIL